ncbi:hypothetical protein R3W88_020028 [Solanum pinnatisectum]|uniref:PB1-like domain-containing protein n=1 Tax=Solanum pinnatisectum TaxID=50273 RepID=A0AAV9KLD9_9SOLN|nr:hypothetical protein R3W88_020028 [Solanum pinnatisectum]
MKIGKKGYKGKPYHGGGVYQFLDINIDRLSYFELRDCLKELGYKPGQCVLYVKLSRSTAMLEIKSDYNTTLIAECLSHGDILDCFVREHLKNSGPNASFDAKLEPTHETQENASNPAPAPASAPTPANSNTSSHVHSFTTPNTPLPTYQTPTPIHPCTDPTLDPVHPSSDPIHDPVYPSNKQDSDRESLNRGFNGSDVNNELRSFREERSKRKRRKVGERAPLPDHVKLGTEKKEKKRARCWV